MLEIQSRRFCPSRRVSERFWMLWHAGGAQFRRDSRQQFQFNRRIRVQKGRLDLAPDVDTWISANLKRPVELEPLSPAICIASSRLSEFHGDPADRLIVATAMLLGLPLMTVDKKIIEWNKTHAALQILNL